MMIELQGHPVTAMVAEFIRTFGASLDFRLWVKLCEEERQELIEACEGTDDAATLKELADLVYVTFGAALVLPEDARILLPADEQVRCVELNEDMDALLGEVMTLYGWSQDIVLEAVTRVHASNMSKLGDDGKPIKRDDGKVLKGPNYAPPDLTDLVEAA